MENPYYPNLSEYIYLENDTDPRTLDWVRIQASKIDEEIRNEFQKFPILERYENFYQSVRKHCGSFYRLIQTKDEPGGKLQCCTAGDISSMPEPEGWVTILDIDALSSIDKVNWCWLGAWPLRNHASKFLVRLSRDSGSTFVVREFDTLTKSFVENGFELPPGRWSVSWISENMISVTGRITADGSFQVHIWYRETPFSSAKTIYTGIGDEINLTCQSIPSATTADFFLLVANLAERKKRISFLNSDGKHWFPDLPTSADIKLTATQILMLLRSEWRGFSIGTVLSFNIELLIEKDHMPEVVFSPTNQDKVIYHNTSANWLAIKIFRGLDCQVLLFVYQDNCWNLCDQQFHNERTTEIDVVPLSSGGSVFRNNESNFDDKPEFLISVEGIFEPRSVYFFCENAEVKELTCKTKDPELKRFVSQRHTIQLADDLELVYDVFGQDETINDPHYLCLLYGYGGFGMVVDRKYNPYLTQFWLREGHRFVIAYIRGGGEFGSAWHNGGRGKFKFQSHIDFASVARDLIAKGLTVKSGLACWGISNGGLLVANMVTQYPDLFEAVVLSNALTDMMRYLEMNPEITNVDEYGDPNDSEDFSTLLKISALHHIRQGQAYPNVLVTGNRDDKNVPVGHGRKFVARLHDLGHDNVFYKEWRHGGHSVGIDAASVAEYYEILFKFLIGRLHT